mgnify:CR=1 FL=1|jgi:transcriptional regulator with XRE-family HTH domain|tara:strand:+ start:23314 stop:23598 length:285 start_codon:yes stop_codon:yes gene_type:complete
MWFLAMNYFTFVPANVKFMVVKYFAEILRELRISNGLSQEKLAERCDLHDRYISFLERGLRQPTISTIFKLGKALDVPASEIIKRIEDKIADSE